MKKKIIIMLLILSCFSFSKNKIKNTTGLAVKPEFNISNDYRKDITPSGTDTISSNREKYFSFLEYSGKKWNTVFIEEMTVFKFVREKLSLYRDTAILFLPRNKRIVCVPKENNISEVFLNGEIQIKTTERNGNICTKSPVEKVLVFSSKIDTKEIGKINIDFNGKIFLNEKRSKEFFK